MNEEIMQLIRQEVIQNFSNLTDEEKELMRINKGTPYTQVIRKLLPQGIFEGLSSGDPQDTVKQRRGLGTR